MTPNMEAKITLYLVNYMNDVAMDYMYNPFRFYNNFDNCIKEGITLCIGSLNFRLLHREPTEKEKEYCKQASTEYADFLKKLYNFRS